MALKHLTDQEIGLRIRWVRIQAGWIKARELAAALGDKDLGIFTKIEKGYSLTPWRLAAIADLCAGRGNVVNDADKVLGFIHGTKEQEDIWVGSTPGSSDIPSYHAKAA